MYLGINLSKEAEDLYACRFHYNMLLREIEENMSNWRDITCL